MKQQSPYKMGTGLSSLLIIMVVLSMTTLSVLALLSAQSDIRLSEKRQSYVKELAQAHNTYQKALFDISEAVSSGQELQAIALSGATLHVEDEGVYLTVPFGDKMSIMAPITLTSNGINPGRYEIVNEAEWEPDDSYNFILP